MSAEPISSGVRAVLDAPRGRRFSRPGTSAVPTPPALPTHEQRFLAQMEGNSRVAYRQAHGELPPWMHVHAARLAERGTPTPEGPARPRKPSMPLKRPQEPAVPRPRPASDDGPFPPRRERPPLPRRPKHPHSQRPHSHRKPRRWFRAGPARLLAAYTLAISTGALAHHLATTLL